MNRQRIKHIADSSAGAASVYLAWSEVVFPWSIASLILAYVFSIWFSMAWGIILYPKKSKLEAGTIAYLVIVATRILLTIVPLLIISLIPGAIPNGLLTLASTYGFARAILLGRGTSAIA
jgi:hypothetical protein